MAEAAFSISWKTVLLNVLVVKRFTNWIQFFYPWEAEEAVEQSRTLGATAAVLPIIA